MLLKVLLTAFAVAALVVSVEFMLSLSCTIPLVLIDASTVFTEAIPDEASTCTHQGSEEALITPAVLGVAIPGFAASTAFFTAFAVAAWVVLSELILSFS